MPTPHSSRPLPLLAAALGVGCAVGTWLSRADAGALLLLGAVALVLAARGSRSRLAPAALAAAALAVGAAAAAVEAAGWEETPLRRWALAADGPLRLSGRLAEDLRELRDHRELLLDVTRLESAGVGYDVRGRARIRVYGSAPPSGLRAGEGVRLWARLAPPRGLRSPGAFDALAWARRRGIHANGVCKSGLLVERRDGAGPGWIARSRGWARAALATHVPPGAEQGLVRAMVLGDRSGVDEQTAEAFRVAGTYHVLALSGAQDPGLRSRRLP